MTAHGLYCTPVGSPQQACPFITFLTHPQMIKPVYGFLSDAVPLFGYRRCSYLVLCGLLGAPRRQKMGCLFVLLPIMFWCSAARHVCWAWRTCCIANTAAAAALPSLPKHPCNPGAACWGGMATVASTPTAVVLLLLLGSASTACADVVADSVVVELVRRPGSKAVRVSGCSVGSSSRRAVVWGAAALALVRPPGGKAAAVGQCLGPVVQE